MVKSTKLSYTNCNFQLSKQTHPLVSTHPPHLANPPPPPPPTCRPRGVFITSLVMPDAHFL